MKRCNLLDICRKSGQIVCLSVFLMPLCIFANEDQVAKRSLASLVPDEEVNPLPFSQELWIESAFKEDNAGVLYRMKETIRGWNESEAYLKRWGLEDSEFYSKTEDGSKKNYLVKNLLKYVDKRISGEIKSADKNSTMFKVGQVKQALRPSSSVNLSPLFKLKFKAKVLQGLIITNVVNPWFNFKVNATLSGKLDIEMDKKIDELNIKFGSKFNISSNESEVYVDQKIWKNLYTKVSSTQKLSQVPISNLSDQKVEFMYAYSF